MDVGRLSFLACLASTLYMAGVIAFVQVVHYPLLARVGPEAFRAYHADHTRLTGLVVALPMVVELVTSLVLVARPTAGANPWLVRAGLTAAVVTWLATFLLSVPLHERLARGGFDAPTLAALVRTNAVRGVAWLVHALILLALVPRSAG